MAKTNVAFVEFREKTSPSQELRGWDDLQYGDGMALFLYNGFMETVGFPIDTIKSVTTHYKEE
jgi:hypothetical protein